MSETVISIENLSKNYRLGAIGRKTLYEDLNRWWAKARGKPDPFLKIGQADHGNQDGEEIWALWDVSLTVQQGEVLGIIGRNGAGKSTLLKILSRVTAPTSGVVKVKGRIASLLEVGTGFHPELTGRENIYMNGSILGMRRTEITRKLDEIVEFADVAKYLDTPVKRYSSGMYVRLAFAVAAHLEPEILVVDEVLAVGDAEFQNKCLGKMSSVASSGRTILFVSHNMASIQTICSRAILLNRGKVSKDGPVQEVIRDYLSAADSAISDNLAIRTDRSGKGEFRLQSIDISVDGSTRAVNLMTGQPAHFIFRLNAAKPRLKLRFTIYDVRGYPIVHFNNAVQGAEDQITETGLIFTCIMDTMYLSPGRYVVNVELSDQLGVQDHIEKALVFDVEAGQQDGRQISRAHGYGVVSIPHRWVIGND